MVAIINKKKTTIAALNEGLIESPHRPYLGMSGLGHACERYLWYTFRWCYPDFITPRVKRLFDRGHEEEARIIRYLEEKGIHTYGDQEEMVDVHGHCKGHNDGRCIGVIEAPKTEHLAEFKTMNDKAFKSVKKDGVRKSKPVYWCQMQTYMHKLKLTRAIFVAVNKNDDDIYIERVYYDEESAIKLLRRAESIILSEFPPKKRFSHTWYECKWCSAKDICHGTTEWSISCRTCKSMEILPEGKWGCEMYGIELCTGQQRLACKNFERQSGVIGE